MGYAGVPHAWLVSVMKEWSSLIAIIMKNFKIIYFFNEERYPLTSIRILSTRYIRSSISWAFLGQEDRKKNIDNLYDKQKNTPGVPTDFESMNLAGCSSLGCIYKRLIHFFPIYQSLPVSSVHCCTVGRWPCLVCMGEYFSSLSFTSGSRLQKCRLCDVSFPGRR